MAKLLPRLEAFQYEEKIAESLSKIDVNNNYSYTALEADLQWLPVGDRSEGTEINVLRDKIMTLVKDEGLTNSTSRASMTKFDHKLGLALLEWLDITPSMAADTGMWAYLNIVLVPDLIKIRWTIKGKINSERFYGNTRNYLGSLWWGAYLADDDKLYNKLSADEFVGWFERTSIRGYPKYINIFMEYFRTKIRENKSLIPVDIYRALIKEINRRLAFINYFALTEENFTQIIDESFSKVIKEKK